MAKYIGIDYGSKKIGLSKSDENGKIAFPLSIISNDKKLFENLFKIIEEENIFHIVIGKSLAQNGKENSLQQEIICFAKKMQEKLPYHSFFFQDERFTSVNAKSFLYGKGNIENERWSEKHNYQKRQNIDDSAATLILQRYLDKQK